MDSEPQNAKRVRRALAAAGHPIMVESPAQLRDATAAWRACQVVGLDTEFVRERTYRADLGLVQISDGETAWLVDPLSSGTVGPLKAFLEDPGIEKVVHSGSEDFEVLFHRLGAVPEGAVDSQIGCAMLGQSLQLGYHNAVDWLFNVEIEKGHTRSNWLRRPLSEGQRRYAALDVVLLPMMMERLRGELECLGRWDWLTEEVARMAQNSTQDAVPKRAWMRVGGAGSLDDKERAILCTLAKWREITARDKNIARGFVVSDPGLMAMAREQPGSMAELQHIDDIHPKAIKRYGRKWLDLIQEARTRPPIPPLPQLTRKQKKWLKAMRARVLQTAKTLNVDAALLASRKQLERLIFAYAESGHVPERFTGWRQDVITDDLLKIMKE